jgi:glycerophosphoryl diester phosphodiesterase
VVIITFGCAAPKERATLMNHFDKQGHRGCRGLMPENTIPAMLHAIDLGVVTLEMDVVFTKDDKIILSHEPFFNHEITTKPDGSFVKEEEEKKLNIYRMNYEEVKTFDVGLKPHPRFPFQQKIKAVKPLLSDVIDSAEEYCRQKKVTPVYYNIETKTQPFTDGIYHPGPDEFVTILMNVIVSKHIQDRVIIQSFDFRTLQYLHQNYPAIKTAALIEDFDKRSFDEQLARLGFVPNIYSPEFSLVTLPLIRQCHKKKIKIIPWTVNDPAKMKELKEMGVDGLITDYPNLFPQL